MLQLDSHRLPDAAIDIDQRRLVFSPVIAVPPTHFQARETLEVRSLHPGHRSPYFLRIANGLIDRHRRTRQPQLTSRTRNRLLRKECNRAPSKCRTQAFAVHSKSITQRLAPPSPPMRKEYTLEIRLQCPQGFSFVEVTQDVRRASEPVEWRLRFIDGLGGPSYKPLSLKN